MKLVNKDLKVSSCGLDVDQGVYSPPEAVKVAKEFNVDLCDNRSKSIHACDIAGTDLLVPMDYDQYQRLLKSYPAMHEKILLLRPFAPKPLAFFCNIDDPFGGDIGDFRRCYALMKRSLDGLLVALNQQSQVR